MDRRHSLLAAAGSALASAIPASAKGLARTLPSGDIWQWGAVDVAALSRPGLSVPTEVVKGVPVGVQSVAPCGREDLALRRARPLKSMRACRRHSISPPGASDARHAADRESASAEFQLKKG